MARRLPWFFTYAAAFLLSALAPAAAFAGFVDYRLAPYVFIVCLAHAIFLGLPAFLVFRARRWIRLLPAIFAGIGIGAAPAALVFWPLRDSSFNESIRGVPTIIDGIPTVAGWLKYAEILSIPAVLGGVGSVTFWLVLRWSGAFALTLDEGEDSKRNRIAIGAVGLAVAGVCTIFVVLMRESLFSGYLDLR